MCVSPSMDALTRAEWRRLRRRIAELQAEVARLRSELDEYRGARVLFCLDRDLAEAMANAAAEADGTRLRSTDTDREFELNGGAWLPVD